MRCRLLRWLHFLAVWVSFLLLRAPFPERASLRSLSMLRRLAIHSEMAASFRRTWLCQAAGRFTPVYDHVPRKRLGPNSAQRQTKEIHAQSLKGMIWCEKNLLLPERHASPATFPGHTALAGLSSEHVNTCCIRETHWGKHQEVNDPH